jgi:hypothetical protein
MSSTIKVSALPDAAALTGTEEVMVVQSGTSRRTTTAEIAQTGAVVYANPTGTVGLSVVNGVAVTAMRSDAAPPLSQSIAPTWTGAHTFSAAVALDGVTTVGGTSINSTGLFTSGVLGVPRGGTGVGTFSQGDIIYASAANVLTALPKDTTPTRYLSNTGASNNPAWALVNLADGVTGNLSVAHLNGGSGASATTFWRGDETWGSVAGGITGLANPSASVGLTAIDGVAVTAMRSDAAPSLDLSIAPTWSGIHTFSNDVLLNGASITVSGTSVRDAALMTSGTVATVRLGSGSATASTVLHGNSTWSAVNLSTDVTANLPVTRLDNGTNASASTFWCGNESWSVPPGATGSSPTASVGLATVNGAAATFMRSDAAPALSQSISPTWSGSHTFSNPVVGASFIPTSSAAPSNGMYLPSANTVGFSSNSTARASVSSSGNWIFDAPSSGSTLEVTGASAAVGVLKISSGFSMAAASPGLQIVSTASGGFATLSLCADSNTPGTDDFAFLQNGTSNAATIVNRSGQAINVAVGATTIMQINAAGAGELVLGAASANNIRINNVTSTSVGATGAAAALPANPLGYWTLSMNGALVKIPYYSS